MNKVTLVILLLHIHYKSKREVQGMGKYIFGVVVVGALLFGVFLLGLSAGVTGKGGRVCGPPADPQSQADVCIVDGVTYVPEEPGNE